MRNLRKNVKAHHLVALFFLLVIILAIAQYSGSKQSHSDGMTGSVGSNPNYEQRPTFTTNSLNPPLASGASGVQPNDTYSGGSAVMGNGNNSGLVPNNRPNEKNYDPSQLLPTDVNSDWKLNPAGNADFQNVNLLKAGHLIGIDTIGSTLRNPNLQIRCEPPNPTTQVSPWQQSTIEPDLMRCNLDIGSNSGQFSGKQ